MDQTNLFHEGERAAQQRANESTKAQRVGQGIGGQIPERAPAFIARQAMVVIGSMDAEGQVWASILTGAPGFMQARDERTLVLERPGVAADDPVWANAREHAAVGLLLIDFESRHRLRINGRWRAEADARYRVEVEAAYGNCPKYIQRRRLKHAGAADAQSSAPARRGTELEPAQRDWIEGADTFFVASAHPGSGVDASHRGGRPGFVQVVDAHTLRIPDYVGNGMFNTLGNFISHPYAGLVFVDFDRARVLQLSGRVHILWDFEDARQISGGTHRYWQLEVEAWREGMLANRLEWDFIEYSPFIPVAGPA